jgi:WD40 repeat protein
MKTDKKLAWKLFSVVIATILLAILALRLFPDLSPKPLRLVRTWKAHKSPITSLAFFPDGQRLLSASWDGTVRIWKVNDGTKMDELSPSRPIRFATLSPDGQLLAISTYDPTIQLWRLSDKTLFRTLRGHRDWVHEVVFSPDGKFLISGSKDGTVKVWQVWDGSLVRTLSGHSKPVVTVALSPDGQFIASGSEDSTVRVWRMAEWISFPLEGRAPARPKNSAWRKRCTSKGDAMNASTCLRCNLLAKTNGRRHSADHENGLSRAFDELRKLLSNPTCRELCGRSDDG